MAKKRHTAKQIIHKLREPGAALSNGRASSGDAILISGRLLRCPVGATDMSPNSPTPELLNPGTLKLGAALRTALLRCS